MQSLAETLCYGVHHEDRATPLLVLCLPAEACDFDDLLPSILDIIRTNARTTRKNGEHVLEYELLIFCAGNHRPSWPWLIHNISKLNKRFRKGLQKLYLVHEKSWIRVCMQLMENIVSPKFGRKICHLRNLSQLAEELGPMMGSITIPAAALEHDRILMDEDTHLRKRRRQASQAVDNQASDIVKAASPRPMERNKSSPPARPPTRSLLRSDSTTREQPKQTPPVIPVRRSTIARTISTGRASTESLIIFEDPDDEPAAERAACALQELLLHSQDQPAPAAVAQVAGSGAGRRSSSAPAVAQEHTPRNLHSLKSAQAKSKPVNTLRRAISGPLTPSRSLKQNYLPPTDRELPAPKLMIHGRQVTVKLKAAQPGDTHGKVGGLKALFEQKALVAQQL